MVVMLFMKKTMTRRGIMMMMIMRRTRRRIRMLRSMRSDLRENKSQCLFTRKFLVDET